MTTKKKSAPAKATAADVVALNTLQVKQVPGKSDALLLAESALSATAGNASTARTFAHHSFGHTGINQSIAVIQEKAAKVQAGDLSEMEALLVAQATSLDAIYTEMARRAALNMGEHLAATEIYMRLALKAQSQCRSTLESLAEIKAPRHVSFVKQANIAHGPQQVNNGNAPAHGNNSIQSNELSEVSNELLQDTRASQVAGRVDTAMEAVGVVVGAADRVREGR